VCWANIQQLFVVVELVVLVVAMHNQGRVKTKLGLMLQAAAHKGPTFRLFSSGLKTRNGELIERL
jgi:hypothetical protein